MTTSQQVRRVPPRPPKGVSLDRSELSFESANLTGEERPRLWQIVTNQFNGNEGAGFAISFVVHVVILMILAVPVIR